MAWRNNNALKWTLSGILLGVGFLFPVLWPLGIFGGAYFLHTAYHTKTIRAQLMGAWFSWSIKAACAIVWFWSTYPIDWLPLPVGDLQLVLIAVYWITVSISLGAGGMVVVLVLRLAKHWRRSRYYGRLLPLIIALAWVIAEVLGSVSFSIMTLGPGGGVSASFSFGHSGYLLAEHGLLLQLAHVGGAYALNAAFALLAFFVWRLSVMDTRYARYAWGAVLLLYVTSFPAFIPAAPHDAGAEAFTVVTIDTRFDPTMLHSADGRAARTDALHKAMIAAVAADPDYVLLPEDSRFFDQNRASSSIKSWFTVRYGDTPITVIDSGRVEQVHKTVLQALIYNGPDAPLATVHKRYLVPQGEYLPAFYSVTLHLFGQDAAITAMRDGLAYEVGSQTSQAKLDDSTPGILFCFESVDPHGVRTLLNERPDLPFVVHPVSHSWFHEPVQLWHELTIMLKVQAVWNQTYIISAGNQMPGTLTTPRGKVVQPTTLATGERWSVRQVTIPR